MSFSRNTAKDAFAITPGAAAFTKTCDAIYIGVAGDVTVTTTAGTSIEFIGLQAGSILPLSVSHVTAATATDLIGLIA